MQFLNVNNANLMKYYLIAKKTDVGLYSLEFDTKLTKLKIYMTTWSKVRAGIIIILDIILILISMIDIRDERENKRLLAKGQAKKDKEAMN